MEIDFNGEPGIIEILSSGKIVLWDPARNKVVDRLYFEELIDHKCPSDTSTTPSRKRGLLDI